MLQSGWFQATNMTTLNMQLGGDVQNWLLWAGRHWLQHTIRKCSHFLWLRLKLLTSVCPSPTSPTSPYTILPSLTLQPRWPPSCPYHKKNPSLSPDLECASLSRLVLPVVTHSCPPQFSCNMSHTRKAFPWSSNLKWLP